MKTPIAGLDDFAALDPFFRIIERGPDGLAGERCRSVFIRSGRWIFI
jgi:hypothetical protein